MAREFDPYRLSNPSLFLMSMVIFLIITGFLAAILYRQIFSAFETNPGLNGLILGVLAVGILLALAQVIRLIPEVGWVNSFRQGDLDLDVGREPVLLAPMKALLGQTSRDVSLVAVAAAEDTQSRTTHQPHGPAPSVGHANKSRTAQHSEAEC